MTAGWVPGHKATPRLRSWLAAPVWWLLPNAAQRWLCGCPICQGREA